MWSAGFTDGQPDPEFLRRVSPPDNEVPVAVPVNAVLARTEDVAVALLGLQVYSTGLSATLAVRLRREGSDFSPYRLNELLFAHGDRSERFLVGVEYADGRRATNLGHHSTDGGLFFSSGGGGGGDRAIDQTWWLSPLPPDGPVRFVVRCPDLGIEEASAVVDGSVIRRGAEGVVELWPWTPEQPYRSEPPPPPDVPDGSWFARP